MNQVFVETFQPKRGDNLQSLLYWKIYGPRPSKYPEHWATDYHLGLLLICIGTSRGSKGLHQPRNLGHVQLIPSRNKTWQWKILHDMEVSGENHRWVFLPNHNNPIGGYEPSQPSQKQLGLNKINHQKLTKMFQHIPTII